MKPPSLLSSIACIRHESVNALEPEWEARFEPRSYGFRPGRGCHDAIQAIYQVVKGKSPKRQWVLDADLAGAFDRIAHDHILSQLGSFPARGMIRAVAEGGRGRAGSAAPHRGGNSPRRCGQPCAVERRPARDGDGRRGPLLHDRRHAGRIVMGSPTVIRYADDFVALCHTRQEALEVKARLAEWLAPRGLAFNEDKTRVVTLDEGFDFLGFNVRRYARQAADQAEQGGRQTDPGTAPHRAAVPARDQRSGGDQTAQPDHSGVGRLLPDTGIRRDLRQAGSLPVAAHLQVGHLQPREQADVLGRSPGTSASSTRPGRTGGCSATAQAARSCTSSPGPTSSDTRSSGNGASPDDPALAEYWARRRRKSAPADQPHRPAAPPSPGRTLRDLQEHARRRRGPATNPARVGTLAGDHPQDDRRRVGPRHVGHG